ncbi:mammalian cell entry protein [Mycolicibacterium lacusdiani]|uniref:mammalian cell entry protein n=1 Tax=Mycolicibacterium lacusdiani TaxID=2895283 RepID=UPI0027E1D197|nr:mammalian cell entry protein [Mycolicibacterium lacusdiani]
MEDQQAGSGDLTAGAVPQGKSARRHRLPRQKPTSTEPVTESVDETAPKTTTSEQLDDVGADEAQSDAVADTSSDDAPANADETTSDDAVEGDTAEAAPVEAASAEETAEPAAATDAGASAPPKRRFPWRRTKSVAPVDAAPAAVEPVDVEPVDVEPVDVEPVAEASETTVTDAVDEPAAETATEDTTPVGATLEGEIEGDTEPAPEPEPVLVPHRKAGRKLKIAAVAAGVLFIGAAAFAGATLQPFLADRAEAQVKFEVAQISADAITTLWTYTPEDMDALPDRAERFLGGDFASDYRRYIDSIVEPNKQAQISNNTQVMGTAVESLTPSAATALVFTNSVATSPVTKGIPSLRYLSYRLDLENRDNTWLITRMTAVTSLDLTPRL